MKCADAEKYLPLYVRSDLGTGRQALVSEHIQNCDNCRQIADDYIDVQRSMRLYGPPEFGADFFDGIRDNVLSSINKTTASVGWRQVLSNSVYRTSLLGASIVLLIIMGGIAVFILKTRKTPRLPDTVATNRQLSIEEGKPVVLNGPDGPDGPDRSLTPADWLSTTGERRVRVGNGRGAAFQLSKVTGRVRRSVNHEITIAPERVEQISRRVLDRPAVAPGDSRAPSPTAHESSALTSITPREALRIDMQTQNPNVRIIWFVPRESNVK